MDKTDEMIQSLRRYLEYRMGPIDWSIHATEEEVEQLRQALIKDQQERREKKEQNQLAGKTTD